MKYKGVFLEKFRINSGVLRVARGGSRVKAPPLAARPLFLWSYQRYTTAWGHSMCQLRLTLFKLTGWLASLDLHKPYTCHILRIASRDSPRLIPISTNTQDSLVS